MGLDEPEEEPVDHKEAFKLFDQNSKGNISARELRLVLGDISESLSSDEIDQLIEEIDPDSDGKINFRGELPRQLSLLSIVTSVFKKSTGRATACPGKILHTRTYSYMLSMIRFLLAIHNLAKCCIGEVKQTTVKTRR